MFFIFTTLKQFYVFLPLFKECFDTKVIPPPLLSLTPPLPITPFSFWMYSSGLPYKAELATSLYHFFIQADYSSRKSIIYDLHETFK